MVNPSISCFFNFGKSFCLYVRQLILGFRDVFSQLKLLCPNHEVNSKNALDSASWFGDVGVWCCLGGVFGDFGVRRLLGRFISVILVPPTPTNTNTQPPTPRGRTPKSQKTKAIEKKTPK